MRKRSRIILWSTALLAVLGMTVWLIPSSRPPDPVYNGHPLSYWMPGPPGMPWMPPPGLDSNAMPYLVYCLKTRDGPARKAYIDLYPHLPIWLRSHFNVPSTAAGRRFVSCRILASMGPAARPAIPELIRLVNSDDEFPIRMVAIDTLSKIAAPDDAAVMECLTAVSKDKDPQIASLAGGVRVYLNSKPAAKAGPDNASLTQ